MTELDVPLDEKGLADVREVEIVVQLGRGPDLSGFQASVIGSRRLDEIRLAPMLEVEFQVFQKCRLVPFDGEIIMRLALADQIVGESALGQPGVGGNVLARDVGRLQQQDGRLDLVRAFDLSTAFYGQGAHFFWA